MKRKSLFWGIFCLIILLSCIDYQFFTEGMADHFSPTIRQAGHLAILIVMIPVGYLGWRSQPALWASNIWIVSYIATVTFIGLLGAIQWKTGMFDTAFLDMVSTLRLFFCSPAPYFMLYILYTVLINKSINGDKSTVL